MNVRESYSPAIEQGTLGRNSFHSRAPTQYSGGKCLHLDLSCTFGEDTATSRTLEVLEKVLEVAPITSRGSESIVISDIVSIAYSVSFLVVPLLTL